MEPDHSSPNSIETRRSFGHRLARLAAVWRREIDADLREYGLTDATWRPIYYLTLSSMPVRQTDLARSLSLEAPSLVRLLDVLEKRGFIVREIDEEDRRSKLVSITEAGRDIAALVSRAADRVATRLTADVSSAELEQCCQIFDRVEQAAIGQKDLPASEKEPAR
ncbi:MarR family transcriptional regulator [Acetobacter indonesiensis]|uniref:MarR family winged helix-turn-helix transcriptional regulator n=1 Tax=Acetobacter indonesiensis TaxID=104101 RepID=UPI001EFFC6EA|nr:MarR family transcriptional regulator [Acetobacter indonesiensis]MCG0996400.1 MarR family transcriptional regulator [Acetobacter indonesiensis]